MVMVVGVGVGGSWQKGGCHLGRGESVDEGKRPAVCVCV